MAPKGASQIFQTNHNASVVVIYSACIENTQDAKCSDEIVKFNF